MFRMVLSLIIMLMVAIFSIQNKDVVFVNFLIWNIQIPLVILAISALTLGAVLVGLLGVVKQISMGRKIRELNGKLKKFENENVSLNNKLENMEKQLAEREALKESDEPKDKHQDKGSPDAQSDTKKEEKPSQDTLLNPTFPIRSE